MKDYEIVELYLKRDEKAIEESKAQYGSRLKALAKGIVHDADIADECENDTYLAAWNAIPPAEPKDYLYPFLARITRCLSINRYNSHERLKNKAEFVAFDSEITECIPADNNTEESVDARLLGRAISRFLYKQKPEKRRIFVRRYWYFDSVEQIAEEFGVSVSKVKSLLFRMRKELGIFLSKEGYNIEK